MYKLDWRDADAYQRLQSATNTRFAWEFLRRAPEYWNAWNEFVEHLLSITKGDEDLTRFVERAYRDCDKAAWQERAAEADWRALRALEKFWVEPEGAPGRKIPAPSFYGQKWGLGSIRAPTDDLDGASVVCAFTEVKGVTEPTSWGLRSLEEQHEDIRDTKWLVLQIDLTWPQDVLISLIGAHISTERARRAQEGLIVPIAQRDRGADRYINLLRTLDAVADSITSKQIGEVLYPNACDEDRQRTKKVEADRKVAIQLRDSLYRVLPLLPESGRAPPAAPAQN